MMWLGRQQSMTGGPRAACSDARRGIALVVALGCFTWFGAGVMAQSQQMHKLFDDVISGAKSAQGVNPDEAPFADDAETTETNSPPLTVKPRVRQPNPSWRAPGGPALGQSQGAINQPGQTIEGMLPLAGADASNDVQLSQNAQGLITLVVRDAPLSRVLSVLAQAQGLNVVAANDIDALISITVRDVPLEEALTAILSVANYTWVRKNNIILVTSLVDSANLPAGVQGRQIQVFNLDFASAASVATSVTGFLSPIGKVSTNVTDPQNNRRTRESVVVEDLPESLARIAAYIHFVDQAPRQVLIEAHILEVKLDDLNKQGIDWNALVRISNQTLNLKTVGMASASASPAFLATLEGGDLGAVVELIQNTTDSKSLGSPKILVINEQEARVQIGEQLGYQGSQTTTETSTFQSVQFLETGVILHLTPRITRDNRVLLHVKPEVSTGKINPVTTIPDKATTELETDVMLRDGQGMVIGGLIKEGDSTIQSKVPYLGDIKGLGWFFRRSDVRKERTEVIVALVPRIQPYCEDWQAYEQGELVRAGVPLMEGPLCRTDRPWDVVLPDGKRVSRPLIPRLPHQECGPFIYWNQSRCSENDQYTIPPYPQPQQRFGGRNCDEENCLPDGPAQARPFLSEENLPASTPAQGRGNGGVSWRASEVIGDQQ